MDESTKASLLRRMLLLRVPTDWSHHGPITFVSGVVRLSGNDESCIKILDGRLTGTLIVPEYISFDQEALNGEIFLTKEGRAVTCSGLIALSSSYFSASGQHRTSFSVFGICIDAMPADDEVAFSRETILGMHLGRDESNWATLVSTRVFGRAAIVAGYCTENASPSLDALQVVYEGEPLTHDERPALFDVLRFLSGVRGNSTVLEVFDRDLAPIGFHFRDHGPTEKHGNIIQPVGLNSVTDNDELALLARDFPRMVEIMHGLRATNPVAVSAAIHHYNDGSIQRYPTSKVRDMSVALEALGVVLLGRQAERRPIIDSDDYTARNAPVLAAFDEAFGDFALTDLDKFRWLRRKIVNLNIASPREELFTALDALDIGLNEKEKTWVRKMRNGVLHSGFYGDETSLPSLRKNAQAAALFANLYARAFLRRLGFTGPYKDAESGSRKLALSAVPDYPLLDD